MLSLFLRPHPLHDYSSKHYEPLEVWPKSPFLNIARPLPDAHRVAGEEMGRLAPALPEWGEDPPRVFPKLNLKQGPADVQGVFGRPARRNAYELGINDTIRG
jgi:hypothetical protein